MASATFHSITCCKHMQWLTNRPDSTSMQILGQMTCHESLETAGVGPHDITRKVHKGTSLKALVSPPTRKIAPALPPPAGLDSE